MKKIFLSLLLLPLFSTNALNAQIVNGLDTLYGHEWIESGGQYLKIKTARDGIYRISGQELLALGIPSEALRGQHMVLWRNGQKEPFYPSTPGPLQAEDYLEFLGRINRAEVDAHLFEGGEQDLLNPDYSLFSDTAVYFLQYGNPMATPLLYTQEHNSPGTQFETLPNLPYAQRINFGDAPVKLPYRGQQVSHFNAYTGYASPSLRTREITVTAPQKSPEAPEAQLKLRLVSSPSATNQPPKNLQIQWNGKELFNAGIPGNQVLDYSFALGPQEVLGSNVLRIHGLGSSADRYQVVFVELGYGRIPNLEGLNLLRWQEKPGSYAVPLEAGLGTETLVVLDPLHLKRRVLSEKEENRFVFKFNNSAETEWWCSPEEEILQLPSLEIVNLEALEDRETEYGFISHPFFIQGPAAPTYQQYVQYRSSPQGGSYRCKTINILDIYNVYGFGIDNHDLALRSFINHMASVNPQFQFVNIIGKGIQFTELRSPQSYSSNQRLNFVSTYGSPGSDNLLGASTISLEKMVNVGRIPVRNEAELKIYLDKIKIQEQTLQPSGYTVEERLPLKKGVHLSGGDPNIQASIRNYMDNLGIVLENTALGAGVSSYYKRSISAVQEPFEQTYNMINEGAFLVTFFGHSATGSFDLNVTDETYYHNAPYFPIMVALGCYSGNFHVPAFTVSEVLSFMANKGFVANVASAGITTPSELNSFARSLYRELGDNLSHPFFRKKLNRVLSEQAQNNLKVSQYMNFLGDPALRHYLPQGPDVSFQVQATQFSPEVLNTDVDSIELKLRMVNLGKNTGETVGLEVQRQLPDGSTVPLLESEVELPSFAKELVLKFPTEQSSYVGRNLIKAQLNRDKKLLELPDPGAYTNNTLEVPFVVFGFDLNPLFPEPFGVVPEEKVELLARVVSPRLEKEDFIVMQMDSSPIFRSPLLQTQKIAFTGGDLIRWTPMGSLEAGKTYYWRVSQDSLSPNRPYVWKQSSFTYLPQKTGWSQRHWGQFLQDSMTNLQIDEHRKWDFASTNLNIDIKLGEYNQDVIPPYLIFNNEGFATSVMPWTNRSSGVFVIVHTNRTAGFWTNRSTGGGRGLHGSLFANNRDLRVFPYDLKSEASRDGLLDLLENVIPKDSRVYFLTIRNTALDSVSTELLQSKGPSGKSILELLQDNGAQLAEEFAQSGKAHYGFIYEKGSDKVFDEGISFVLDIPVFLKTDYRIYAQKGQYKSPVVGPVKHWREYNAMHAAPQGEQKAFWQLWGRRDQSWEILREVENQTHLEGDLEEESYQGIDLYQWHYTTQDSLSSRAVGVKQLNFFYEPLDDWMVYEDRSSSSLADTLISGQTLKGQVVLEALSFSPGSDSLAVSLRLRNTKGFFQETTEVMYLDKLQNTYAFELSTDDLEGLLLLEVEINSDRRTKERDYENNIFSHSLVVKGDKVQPLLSVNIDGRIPLLGDLVASNPIILVVAKDENPFKLLDDISLFDFSIKRPGQTVALSLQWELEDFQFYPAREGQENAASIEWKPQFKESGDYELWINVRDKEGNLAGQNPLQIQFKVVVENSISNFLNYPNPFSDRTRFAYTLTGANVPYDYKLEIYTVSGKLIREIKQEELGPLKVGTHMTDYAWDARDQFGNRLANGVYLYRLVIRDQDKEQPLHFESQADQYSKNRFGKMVLIK